MAQGAGVFANRENNQQPLLMQTTPFACATQECSRVAVSFDWSGVSYDFSTQRTTANSKQSAHVHGLSHAYLRVVGQVVPVCNSTRARCGRP